MHPGAVDYTVKELLKRYDEIEDFYGYGKRILKTANGNFCEKDHIEDHERVKKDFAEYVNGSPELKAMIGKIGDRIWMEAKDDTESIKRPQARAGSQDV